MSLGFTQRLGTVDRHRAMGIVRHINTNAPLDAGITVLPILNSDVRSGTAAVKVCKAKKNKTKRQLIIVVKSPLAKRLLRLHR